MKSAVQGRVVINLAKQRGSEDEDEDELVWWGDGGICKNVVCACQCIFCKKSFVSMVPGRLDLLQNKCFITFPRKKDPDPMARGT